MNRVDQIPRHVRIGVIRDQYPLTVRRSITPVIDRIADIQSPTQSVIRRYR
jgi:hypothetical protein